MQVAKSILEILAIVIVSPLLLLFTLHSVVQPKHVIFQGYSQLLSLAPGTSGQFLRRAFYRFTLKRCDSHSCVSFGVLFSHPNASVGRHTYIGPNCIIGSIDIGEDVLIGSNVSIMNGCRQHGIEKLDVSIREQKGEYLPVKIGKDTWIGDQAVIMANVGSHCVVGAGSVVTKEVPPYSIVAGNPAKVLRDRRDSLVDKPIDNASSARDVNK